MRHTRVTQQYYVENEILLPLPVKKKTQIFSGNNVIFRKVKFGTEKNLAKATRTYNTVDV